MKLMFASDIHGSSYYCEKLKEKFIQTGAEKLILLGDLLYHGARNDLTLEYNPKKVTEILNSLKNSIICVRGNCDSEVDQMVLDFPIQADYTTVYANGKMLFITHGHVYNNDKLPKLNKGDILIHGHTHIPKIEDMGDYYYINPGSIGLPKDGNKSTYMLYEDGCFSIMDLEDNIIMKKRI